MIDRVELKIDARRKIRGNLGILFLCGFIIAVICGVVIAPFTILTQNAGEAGNETAAGLYNLGGTVLGSFVSAPFTVALSLIYLNLVNGVRPKVADIFEGFHIYKKTVGLYWWVSLFSFLWMLPTYAGMALIAVGTNTMRGNGSEMLGVAMTIFGGLLTLAAMVFGMIKVLRYTQAFYVLADQPERGVRDCLNESKRLMKGHCGEYFVLTLTFLGWIVLGAFTLCILYIWLVPYMNATFANYYYKLKELGGAPTLAELE